MSTQVLKIGEWTDDLIWCPSQCECRLETNGRFFTLYLRWRWSNPWSCRLWEVDENGKDLDPNQYWNNPLPIRPWSDEDDLDKIKEDALQCALEWLINEKALPQNATIHNDQERRLGN